MIRYYIYPANMPPYNTFTVEVSKEQFETLLDELATCSSVTITSDTEAFCGEWVEKWYIDYTEYGKQVGKRSFGFSLAPLGEIDT